MKRKWQRKILSCQLGATTWEKNAKKPPINLCQGNQMERRLVSKPYPKEIDLQKDSMALLRETRRERIKGKNIHQENTDSFQDITRRQKISKEKEREGDGEKEAKARTFIRR
jgi:hypothetical protein